MSCPRQRDEQSGDLLEEPLQRHVVHHPGQRTQQRAQIIGRGGRPHRPGRMGLDQRAPSGCRQLSGNLDLFEGPFRVHRRSGPSHAELAHCLDRRTFVPPTEPDTRQRGPDAHIESAGIGADESQIERRERGTHWIPGLGGVGP